MVVDYNKRLSREEVVSKLDNFLNIIKNDYSFLWEGNPSLINKYGGCPTYFGKKSEFVSNSDFNKFIPFSTFLPNHSQGRFDALGIAKEEGKFKFYLEVADIPDYEFYETGKEVYDALEKQFDLSTENCMNDFAKGIYTNLEKILKGEFNDNLLNLKNKLNLK